MGTISWRPSERLEVVIGRMASPWVRMNSWLLGRLRVVVAIQKLIPPVPAQTPYGSAPVQTSYGFVPRGGFAGVPLIENPRKKRKLFLLLLPAPLIPLPVLPTNAAGQPPFAEAAAMRGSEMNFRPIRLAPVRPAPVTPSRQGNFFGLGLPLNPAIQQLRRRETGPHLNAPPENAPLRTSVCPAQTAPPLNAPSQTSLNNPWTSVNMPFGPCHTGAVPARTASKHADCDRTTDTVYYQTNQSVSAGRELVIAERVIVKLE